MIYFSTLTKGFYNDEWHGSPGTVDCKIPPDAVEITEERWRELLTGQRQGFRIEGGDDGLPILIDCSHERKAEADRLAAIADTYSKADAAIEKATKDIEKAARIEEVLPIVKAMIAVMFDLMGIIRQR